MTGTITNGAVGSWSQNRAGSPPNVSSCSRAPYLLDEPRRSFVLAAIQKHCEFRGWNLLAAHVRSNHVHVILESKTPPEKILNEFKSYASRELNHRKLDGPDRKRWAKHGSTRWLWKDETCLQAIKYVVEEQGDPMALFVAEEL